MILLANISIAFVALLHIGFLVLEIFLWKKPLGRRVFGLTAEQAEFSAPLAASQGLYNGFLAAGLVWGLLAGPTGTSIKLFFLGCVVLAGIFGALTAKRLILWVQALPGLIALLLVLMSG